MTVASVTKETKTMNEVNETSYSYSQIILGIDLGTSGLRASIVERRFSHKIEMLDRQGFPDTRQDRILAECKIAIADSQSHSDTVLSQHDKQPSIHPGPASIQNPRVWLSSLEALLKQLKERVPLNRIDVVIADATSSTVMLCSEKGQLLTHALMYNDAQAEDEAKLIARFQQTYKERNGDFETAASGVSSSLAKVLYLYQRLRQRNLHNQRLQIVHQIDWLNNYFLNFLSEGQCVSDENNLLKLGYDPAKGDYPQWLRQLLKQEAPQLCLPEVGIPGEPIGVIHPDLAQRFGFKSDCRILFGSTDSIAGFFASGATSNGDAVTSLGSTLAIKQLAQRPVFSPQHGLYSHKVHQYWLVGGASNSGGKVLLKYYSLEAIKLLDWLAVTLWKCATGNKKDISRNADKALYRALSKMCEMVVSLGDYYPLAASGERFPVADNNYQPRLEAKPESLLKEEIVLALETLRNEKPVDDLQQISSRIGQALNSEQTACLLEHLRFFISIVQGLTQVEKKAYDLMAELGVQRNALYAVGGGTHNNYWQLLRACHLQNSQNPLQSPFSLEASYGITRLARL
ncbi:FGGY-family carbohydrate kinase [Thiomicrorhabdus sp. 6S3-12]|uniref:FGGY-family carbohydrate kinase n=1 Tax=Thiomicrorhabdus sp. 6S3-12 TaxID=2819681 RepID=UPI001AACB200|nr:hypothetical protein [Thiomicrorhabdus sp. 6S3-12]MBO1925154.1 hypothetical protein [Thiomicrorhabdus sp. 6S3-12]